MDDERIYIVGRDQAQREQRAVANGAAILLNRRYELLEKHIISGFRGVKACCLREIDHSEGSVPVS